MNILITWGTKMGGTEGIARILGEQLTAADHRVSLAPAAAVRDLAAFDAVIVGGALYANRWHRDARRFVGRHVAELRRIPVWFFSSGPLDDSAERDAIAPSPQVRTLMERVGARGHVTFGGRLRADATGFPAAAMAKEHAGDWRNPAHVRRWADALARELPAARPGDAVDHPGRSAARVVAHALATWGVAAAVATAMFAAAGPTAAAVLRAAAAPLVAALVARRYFAARGAREPLATAIAFAAIAVGLDLAWLGLAVTGLVGLDAGSFPRDLMTTAAYLGTWLPLVLAFLATWLTGFIMSTLPWPRPAPRAPSPPSTATGSTGAAR
jgi:menaquinone-dependent protoporphyrinogen oxidase